MEIKEIIALTFLICFYYKPDENEYQEEEREEAKCRHWDED